MSFQAVTWVRMEVDGLTPAQKLTLMCMADYAQPDGTGVFPTRQRLAMEVGVSVRQLQRLLEDLERRGLIRRGDQSIVQRRMKNPRYAPVVWDLAMAGSATDRLQAHLPPLGADDRDPGSGGPGGDGIEREAPPEDPALSQVNSGDILSSLPDLRKHGDESQLVRNEVNDLSETGASSQVNRGDNMSPLPDLRKCDLPDPVDICVDNVGTTSEIASAEVTSDASRGDIEGSSEGTLMSHRTVIRTTNQPPPAGANPSEVPQGVGSAPAGGPGGPLVVVDSSGPDSVAGAPGGGHRAGVKAICDAVLAGLPEPLRVQVGRQVVLAACEPLAGLRVEPATVNRLVRRRGWERAGPGVVIRWLRDEVAELLVADRAAWEPELPASVRVPWCGRCDDPASRWVPAPDGRGVTWCPDCHPRMVCSTAERRGRAG